MTKQKKDENDNKEKKLNKLQKPWAIVCYDDDGVDYVFFDDEETANRTCDANVALGYCAEVVNCRTTARRQAIEWIMSNVELKSIADVDKLDKLYEGFLKHGLPIFDLSEEDKKYVFKVITDYLEEKDNDDDNENDCDDDDEDEDDDDDIVVEVDESAFSRRLHIATKVMESCLEKADYADFFDIARSLDKDGYGRSLLESYDDDGHPAVSLSICKFSAAMAESLYDSVHASFVEEE